MHAILICSAAMLISGRLPPAESLWINLGPQNREHGLATPSGGDGTNVAETVAGSSCRRMSGPRSQYLYVKADAARVPPGCYDVYLAVRCRNTWEFGEAVAQALRHPDRLLGRQCEPSRTVITHCDGSMRRGSPTAFCTTTPVRNRKRWMA